MTINVEYANAETQYQDGLEWARGVLPWSVTDELLVTADGLYTGHRAVIRRDDADGQRRVIGVVASRYAYAQPQEMLARNVFPFLAAGCKHERTAVLKHGSKIAVQLSLPSEAIRIGGEIGTEILPLMTYADSFDGSTPAFIRDICQVVVCQNTHAMAMDEARELRATVRHSGGNETFAERLAECAQSVAGRLTHWREVQVPRMRDVYDRSDNSQHHRLDEYFACVLTADRLSRAVKTVRELYDLRQIGKTGNLAWDAPQAITQWLAHERGRSQDGRDFSSTAGKDALLGARAWELSANMLTEV